MNTTNLLNQQVIANAELTKLLVEMEERNRDKSFNARPITTVLENANIPLTRNQVNKLLVQAGLMIKCGNKYMLTELGSTYGVQIYDGKCEPHLVHWVKDVLKHPDLSNLIQTAVGTCAIDYVPTHTKLDTVKIDWN